MNFHLNLVSLNLLFHMCKNSRPLGDPFFFFKYQIRSDQSLSRVQLFATP